MLGPAPTAAFSPAYRSRTWPLACSTAMTFKLGIRCLRGWRGFRGGMPRSSRARIGLEFRMSYADASGISVHSSKMVMFDVLTDIFASLRLKGEAAFPLQISCALGQRDERHVLVESPLGKGA